MSEPADRSQPQRAVSANQSPEHPARSVMTRRWEERRARRDTLAGEPTVSRVQTLPSRSGADATPTPPAIPSVAFTIRSQLPPRLTSPLADLPAADGGEPITKISLISNPQRALLVVAVVAITALLSLLYFGGFLAKS